METCTGDAPTGIYGTASAEAGGKRFVANPYRLEREGDGLVIYYDTDGAGLVELFRGDGEEVQELFFMMLRWLDDEQKALYGEDEGEPQMPCSMHMGPKPLHGRQKARRAHPGPGQGRAPADWRGGQHGAARAKKPGRRRHGQER